MHSQPRKQLKIEHATRSPSYRETHAALGSRLTTRSTAPVIVLFLSIGLVSVSCEKGQKVGADAAVDGSSTSEVTTAVVSSEGGLVEHAGNVAALEFPPGAVGHSATISIARVTLPPAGALGPVFEFLPSGLQFARPVKVILSYSGLAVGAADVQRLRVARYEGERWVALSGHVLDESGTVVVGETLHFSMYALVLEQSADGGVLVDAPPIPGAPCASGTFDHDANASTFCQEWAACAPGTYVSRSPTANQDRQCSPCIPGTFSATTNAAECAVWTVCKGGEYVDRAGSSALDQVCATCPTGTYSRANNSSTCVPHGACAPGSEQTAEATSTEAAVCVACGAGNYCAGGTTSRRVCSGYTWDHDGNPASACVAKTTCQAGQAVSADGGAATDRACTACTTGTHSTGVNASACVPWTSCQPGEKVTNGGTATADRTCAPCSSGLHSKLVNATMCAPWSQCAPGTYIVAPGSATADRVCAACPAETTATMPNQSSCQSHGACVAGSEQTAAATASMAAECKACPAGSHCGGATAAMVACAATEWDHDGNAATACVAKANCGAGKYVADGGSPTSDRICANCPAGSFSAAVNASACVQWTVCQPGQSVVSGGTATSNRTCAPCASGSSSGGMNAPSCVLWQECAAGKYVTHAPSFTGDRACAACPGGTFSAQPNQALCWPHGACAAGTEQVVAATATMPPVCTECAAATYCAGGAAAKVACADGTWDDDGDAATTCVAWTVCGAGQRMAAAGSATADRKCEACSNGFFSPGENAEVCAPWTVCAVGQRVSRAGSGTVDRVCTPCGSGTYSRAENAAACAAWATCAAGTFVSNEPSVAVDRICTTCATGTYAASANQTTCFPQGACPAGSEQIAPAATTMPPGCAPCAAGTHCPGGESVKEICSSTTWDHDASAATACATKTSCGAGQHVVDGGNATTDRTCVACLPEHYSTGTNATSCLAMTTCAAGQYVDTAGTLTTDRVCQACPAERYSPMQNAQTCVAWSTCPAGEWVTNTPSATLDRACAACAEGMYTTQPNQSTCLTQDMCAAGTEQTVAATSMMNAMCAACSPGHHCPGGVAPKSPCAVGSWDSDGNAATVCVGKTVCGEGEYVVAEGTATVDRGCAGCVIGYSTTTNAQSCTEWAVCKPGQSVDMAGSATTNRTCAVCADGHFSAMKNEMSCTPWTTCMAPETQLQAGTNETDRVCGIPPEWTKQWGSFNVDEVRGVAVDSVGNVYAGGFTAGSLGGTNAGSDDAFVTKLGVDGSLAWTRQWGTSLGDQVWAVAVDGSGNLYAAGRTAGALTTTLGGLDAFVRKLSPTGTTLWTRQWGTASTDQAMGLVLDSDGNAYVCGQTSGALGGSPLGGTDAFVTKLTADGAIAWSKQWGTSTDDGCAAIARDSAGNLYAAGQTLGNLAGTNGGQFDAFITKLDANGTVLWSRQWGDSDLNYALAVAVDTAGDTFVGGYTPGHLGGPRMGRWDSFLLKVDGSGTLQWSKEYVASTSGLMMALRIDGSGFLYTAGTMYTDEKNAYMSKVDGTGTTIWRREWGSPSADEGYALSISPTGYLYVGGKTWGSLQGTSAGSQDAFVTRLSRSYGP
jgi:hypothetical protein